MAWSQPSWTRGLPRGVVTGLATLGPLGRRLPAPGTWGSLVGVLYFVAVLQHASVATVLLATAIAGYCAVAVCGEAEIRLGKTDPGEVVLDEIVAMPLCFLGWRSLPPVLPDWGVWLAGFLLFRLFDIVKPLGIRKLQTLPGGWGVVADDLVAALMACAALHIGAWGWQQF